MHLQAGHAVVLIVCTEVPPKQPQGEAPLVAAMSCGREMTASIKPYSVASSAPMKKSLSVSCAAMETVNTRAAPATVEGF